MPTYVLLNKLTDRGYGTTHHNPDRLDAVAAEIQKLGCEVVAQHALLGEWDALSIIEAPDAEEFEANLRGDVHLAQTASPMPDAQGRAPHRFLIIRQRRRRPLRRFRGLARRCLRILRPPPPPSPLR